MSDIEKLDIDDIIEEVEKEEPESKKKKIYQKINQKSLRKRKKRNCQFFQLYVFFS